MLTQRLGGLNQLKGEYIDELCKIIKNNPGSCDEVWFTSKSGFPPVDVHKETARLINEQADKFRKIGVRVSLQIQSTIGHGQYMQTQDNTGLVYEGSPAEHLVGPDGTSADYCFCWRGKHFREYTLNVYREFAKIKPHTFWVDDDFRANNHSPVSIGCFCDNCIKEFNEKYGTDYTREQLVHEINYGDVAVRENFAEFTREGLYNLMYEISKAVHEISPDSYMGYQYCANGGYTGFGFEHVFDAMKKGTGKTPKSRPGGGAYQGHNPNDFIAKSRFIDWANFMLPDKEIEKRPEIENLPDIVYGKSIQNTCFETTLYLAHGNDAMSYAMMQNEREPLWYHAQMLSAFAKRRKYWQKLIDANKDTFQSGLSMAYTPNRYKRKIPEKSALFDWANEVYWLYDDLWRTVAIPMCFKKENPTTVLLHPAALSGMTEEEILSLLSKPVITDGETIATLYKMGFGDYLDISVEKKESGKFHEILLRNHPVNKDVNGDGVWNVSVFVSRNSYQYEIFGDKFEPVSKFNTSRKNVEKTGNEEFPYGVASAVFHTKLGAKWACMGEYPWCGIMSFDKRNQLINIANYLCEDSIKTILETPIQALILPRENKDGKITSVSVLNKTVGDSGILKLRIKNPASEKFTFMTFKDDAVYETNVAYSVENGDYVLDVPNISAWGIGTVFAE